MVSNVQASCHLIIYSKIKRERKKSFKKCEREITEEKRGGGDRREREKVYWFFLWKILTVLIISVVILEFFLNTYNKIS